MFKNELCKKRTRVKIKSRFYCLSRKKFCYKYGTHLETMVFYSVLPSIPSSIRAHKEGFSTRLLLASSSRLPLGFFYSATTGFYYYSSTGFSYLASTAVYWLLVRGFYWLLVLASTGFYWLLLLGFYRGSTRLLLNFSTGLQLVSTICILLAFKN